MAAALLGASAVPALAQKAYQDRPTDKYDQPIHVPGGPVPTVYVSYPFLFFDQGGLRTVIQNATNIADEGLKQCNKQLFNDSIKSLRYYLSVLHEAQQHAEQDIDVWRARWVGGGLDPADFKPPSYDTEQIQELTDDANTIASVINWLLARQNWAKCAPPEHAMVAPPPSSTAVAATPPLFSTTAVALVTPPQLFYNSWYVGLSAGPSFVPTYKATEFFDDGFKDRFPWGSNTGYYGGFRLGDE
ncbi:MAG TPA: hypothetical protein VGR70_06745, partial [Stellaceae bacterium]|nr:hypothetical protein [Stellaceae bacterium]